MSTNFHKKKTARASAQWVVKNLEIEYVADEILFLPSGGGWDCSLHRRSGRKNIFFFFCLLASKERRRRRLVELEQTAGGQESGARNHEKQMKINNCFSFFSPHLVLSPIKLLGAVMSDDDDGYRNNKTEKERKAIKRGRFSLALELWNSQKYAFFFFHPLLFFSSPHVLVKQNTNFLKVKNSGKIKNESHKTQKSFADFFFHNFSRALVPQSQREMIAEKNYRQGRRELFSSFFAYFCQRFRLCCCVLCSW